MDFDIKRVKTTVNADTARKEGVVGYFSNNLESLRNSVLREKQNVFTIYDVLDAVLAEKFERRFSCSSGNFSLFYPTDKCINNSRY